MQRVMLGRTGIEVSLLGIGTGTRSWSKTSSQTRNLGLVGLADLLVYAYEQGITFIDTADQYGSHPHIRKALERIPREQVVITTKTIARNAK
jgi:aryl-alcohol dehydrogenase-like predicted oxidoreductase